MGRIVGAHELLTGITHADNTYFSLAPPADQFDYNGSYMDKTAFDAQVGDTTSVYAQLTFVDDSLSIETYMTSLGQTSTIDEFKAKCNAQGDGTWDINYTASYINAYFRAGYKTV